MYFPASTQINVPLRKIQTALSIPMEGEDKEISKVGLPAAGARLMHNPEKEKKTKKKLKGKGTSKGKKKK